MKSLDNLENMRVWIDDVEHVGHLLRLNFVNRSMGAATFDDAVASIHVGIGFTIELMYSSESGGRFRHQIDGVAYEVDTSVDDECRIWCMLDSPKRIAENAEREREYAARVAELERRGVFDSDGYDVSADYPRHAKWWTVVTDEDRLVHYGSLDEAREDAEQFEDIGIMAPSGVTIVSDSVTIGSGDVRSFDERRDAAFAEFTGRLAEIRAAEIAATVTAEKWA